MSEMNTTPDLPIAPRVDPLRERVAAAELAEARAIAAHGGLAALIAHAHAQVGEARRTRRRVETLAEELDAARDRASDRARLVEAYLRETVTHPRSLRADLRALAHGGAHGDDTLELEALSERAARRAADLERAAEAALALATASISGEGTPDAAGSLDPLPVLALCRDPGAWSRRVEALGLLRALGERSLAAEVKPTLRATLRTLAARDEHRWVQPAALAALASFDPRLALALARERLSRPGEGDDFLVRERIVDLATRGAIGPHAPAVIASLARADASEHVRVGLACGERDRERLAYLATEDASHRVRAVALVSLAARHGAVDALTAAIEHDRSDVVVRIAAEELMGLAERGQVRDAASTLDALTRAARRHELAAPTHARLAEALAAVAVATDPRSQAAHDQLAAAIAETPVGGSSKLRHDALDGRGGTDAVAGLDDAKLARVLAVLARGAYGVAIDRLPTGLRLHRGDARVFTLWRVLHELLHPSPSKRQAFQHTLGHAPRGELRAPPSGLAELTATRVPGERVLGARGDGWGRSVPLVDDFLSLSLLRPRTVTIAGPTGVTRMQPPARLSERVRGRLSLVFGYARLAALRKHSLDAPEPAAQSAFLNEIARVTGISVRFEPYALDGVRSSLALVPDGLARQTLVTGPARPAGNGLAGPDRALPRGAISAFVPPVILPLLPVLASASDALPRAREILGDLARYAASPEGNRLPHLAAYATVVLGAFLLRSGVIRRGIEADRAAIPLVIGGWGTRGKSGTERLKAALFQGLGHETLVKTTGCEAMFIHAIPGVPAREIFVHRPYDKATVWEQRDLLELARRLRVRVFLWECMALQPELVSLLQSQWMRDDFSTITNAYPDHEDVQGPTGYDVASVISEFVPTNGNLLTTEEQMLPLLRERARERGTKLHAVDEREAELLPEDLLARFPYREHPRNVALVAALARALGVPRSIAIAEMADHVVADLGALNESRAVPYLGRTLSFINGMSANERTGALGNWRRCGLDAHEPDAEPATRIVTLVNNRGDRVARSEVFARFLAEDVSAHAHFVIGTNVGGFLGFLKQAVAAEARALSPTRELHGDGTERLRAAHARVDRAFRRMQIARTDAASVREALDALGLASPPDALLDRLLKPAAPEEPYERASAVVEAALVASPSEDRPHLVRMIAARRTVRAVHQMLAGNLASRPEAVDRVFRAAFEALFHASVVAIHDPATSGDRLLDAIATASPRGARVRIVGLQNIKGTGLDFVYRWVSIDTVCRLLDALGAPEPDSRATAARALARHADYGVVDATHALARLERALASETEPLVRAALEAAISHLRPIVTQRAARLSARHVGTLGEALRGAFGRTFDYLDASRRRRLCGDVIDALVAGRLSHATAARRMREILARAKGAWMTPARAT
jgi:poly-gamma-glutamate synthase PgsB/CapB